MPDLSSVLKSPIHNYVRRELVTVDEREAVSRAARIMSQKGTGSVPVSRRGEIIEILTERDILNKVVANGQDSSRKKVCAAMSSPLISTKLDTTVEEALATMASHDIRRLAVKDGDKIVGIISQRAVFGDSHIKFAPMIELESPKGVLSILL